MQILVDQNGKVIYIGESFSYGYVDPTEPEIKKWKISDNLYAIGDDLVKIEGLEIPEYVRPEKYLYRDEQFVINPEYHEPVDMHSLYSQITNLQLALAELVEGGIN